MDLNSVNSMDVIEENNDEETNEITKNNTSKDDSENGNLFLEVPVRTHSGTYSYKSSVSVNSDKSTSSKKSTFRMRPAKWFWKSEGFSRRGSELSPRSRTSSNGSKMSRDSETETRSGRKHSVFNGIVRKGRTVRRKMSNFRINEASESDDETGRDGSVLTAEQKLRMYTLKEIVTTEEEYVKLLQYVVDVIMPSLQVCAKDENIVSVTNKTISNLLSNVKEIHKLHVKLVAELEQATSPSPYYTDCIGNIFLKYKNEFVVYADYCSNFSTAQRVSYELDSDPIVTKLINEWKEGVESKTRRFLHLEDFIISPVQRLCKYPLLLRELEKFTFESHLDQKPVADAKQMMEEVTMSVNESERRAIAVQAIRDLEDSCDSWERSGKLTKQGFMTKRGNSVKTWCIRWFILSGYSMTFFSEPTDIKPLGVLDLTSYKALEDDVSVLTERPHSFGIRMPDRTHFMYCTSEKEKQEWITILKWKFSCIERSRRQAHRPLETVIFASLSSFLNPKNQNATFREPENPIGEQIEEKQRSKSKSFFRASFRRLSRRNRPRESTS